MTKNDLTIAIAGTAFAVVFLFIGIGFWLISDSHIAQGTVAIATFTAMLAVLASVTAIYAYKAAQAANQQATSAHSMLTNAEEQVEISRRMLLDSNLPVISAKPQFIGRNSRLVVEISNIGNGPALNIRAFIDDIHDPRNPDEIEVEVRDSLSNRKEDSHKLRFKMKKAEFELPDWHIDIRWYDIYDRKHWSRVTYLGGEWHQKFSQRLSDH